MNKQKLVKFTPFIIGGIISIGVLVGGFMVMSGSFTRAADYEPHGIAVSNLTDNSATVTWTTGMESQGIVQYGISSGSLTSVAPETHKVKNHSMILSLLSTNTTYYFQIQISGKTYDNGGVPWTFTTSGGVKPTTLTPSPPAANPTPASRVIQRLNVMATPTPACNGTDCDQIKARIGTGCTSQQYWYCVQRTTPSNH